MSWRKYFTPVPVKNAESASLIPGNKPGPAKSNYSSFLPDVYAGTPNRLERYAQYDTMDMDPEVNAALDILAEFCTQKSLENDTAFRLAFKGSPTNTEVKILKDSLQKWYKIQKFENRIFRIVRNVFKYGDCFFIREPETQKWYYVDCAKITKIIVNESEGKRPEQYVVRDLNINFKNLVATDIHPNTNNAPAGTASYLSGGAFGRGMVGSAPQQTGSRFSANQNETFINAEHLIHLSLSEGLDNNYPFGNSLLESVFKVYKQKELLEDAVIIYRVQRAPERRVFYVDVGNMPPHMAMSFVERVKNEIHQRRIPSQTGGGQSVVDAAYNPLSTNEDYFFPQSAEGRGSKVETLPGGTNLGEITDLKYFTNKLFRALRIPSSYLPTSEDDSSVAVQDGKVGTAYIQELRFNKYCERLQNMLSEIFDNEFKFFLHETGINIDASLYDLRFNLPQNFAAYRQSELDTTRVQTFASVQELPYLSKRFALKRYLGLTQEEISENEKLWKEENSGTLIEPLATDTQLRGVGITPAGISSDIEGQNMELPPGEGEMTPGEGEVDTASAPGTSQSQGGPTFGM